MTTTAPAPEPDADAGIRAVVERLARPHSSGGVTIERAAVMAEADSAAILRWIEKHAGEAEEAATATPSGGLHGGKLSQSSGSAARSPSRYLLPPGVCAGR